MRIILLNDVGIYDTVLPNRYIGPYVLATQLESIGFEVIVVDWVTRLTDILAYIEELLTPDTLFIGISSTLMALPLQYDGAGKLLRTFRASNYNRGYLWFETPEELEDWSSKLKNLLHNYNPDAKLILGGAKTPYIFGRSHSKKMQIAYKHFDSIVMGMAENNIIEIANNIKDNIFLNIHVKDGLKFYKATTILNDKNCPPTIWKGHQAIMQGEALPLEVARGCAFNCKFCNYEKKSFNLKNLSILKDELIRNYENFGTTVYNFCDDCFNDNRNKVFDTCDMLQTLPFKIEWISYARMDLAVKFPETFDAMVESGCRGVCFGIESLNYESVRRAGKGVHPDKVKESLLRMYQQHHDKCFFQCSFIVGLPYETKESQRETMKWFQENKSFDFASVGALGIPEYNPDSDDGFVDYADYSINPQKYGFRNISNDPYYWEHDTMNYHEAKELALEWNNILNADIDAATMSIWAYPPLRSLGFSFDDICDIMRNNENKEYWQKLLNTKSSKFLVDYFTALKEKNVKDN